MGLPKPLKNSLSLTQPGPKNLITDVPGVLVGQTTIQTNHLQTGVTAIIPASGNLFRQKLVASCHVINGFGKSTGLVQIKELGTLETPLILTNTFAVGTAYTSLVKYMLQANPEIGTTTGTVNPVVLECNDGHINAIRALGIKEADVQAALEQAGPDFLEGNVGGGTGMRCYNLKGGIGSTSRQIMIDRKPFMLGVLVMANFGFLEDLTIYGQPIGQQLVQHRNLPENGSIITVIATDIPFNERQLQRLAKHSSVGITRSGSFAGNGSGEITLAFSTANRVDHFAQQELSVKTAINDTQMDRYFRVIVDTVNEAILSALVHAQTVVDRQGNPCWSLRDALVNLGADNHMAQGLLRDLGLK